MLLQICKIDSIESISFIIFCHTLPQATARTHLGLLVILEKQLIKLNIRYFFQPPEKKHTEILIGWYSISI